MALLSNCIMWMTDKIIEVTMFLMSCLINGIIAFSEGRFLMIATNILTGLIVLAITILILIGIFCKMVGVKPGDISMATFTVKRYIKWKYCVIIRYIRFNLF